MGLGPAHCVAETPPPRPWSGSEEAARLARKFVLLMSIVAVSHERPPPALVRVRVRVRVTGLGLARVRVRVG